MTRNFWENWLQVWIWMTMGFGLLFAGAGVPPLDAGAGLFYAIVSGGTVSASDFSAPGMRISVSLVGAVMFGWGVCLLAVFRARGADVGLWRGLTWGVLGWYLVDSALSVMNGFAFNAVSNSLFLIVFLVPAVKLGFFSRETVSRSPA